MIRMLTLMGYIEFLVGLIFLGGSFAVDMTSILFFCLQ